jgi:sec-independent protein translocase protein TatC
MKLTLVKTSDFIFRTKLFRIYDMELPFLEHVEELRQRIFQLVIIFISVITFVFINVKTLVELIEKPVTMIKFIQLSPGEYLVSTIKIAIYTGLLICIPIILSQIICFIFPGLTLREKKFILPLILISFTLFNLSLNFSYSILIPAALKFFIQYSENVIEPLWSFDQYLDFTLLIFYSTSLAFQIPIFQLILGLTGVLSGKKMLSLWKYVVLGSTIVGAVLTPSTDPITQLCLSSAIFVLYLLGSTILFIYQNIAF